MTWYRGDDKDTGGSWYAADREYAEFFGSAVSTVDVDAGEILDLTRYGVGDEETVVDEPGLPEYSDVEMYLYVEREDVREVALDLGYRAIRVLQWHSDFSGDPQDTIFLLAR